ncbi:MAG TPA: ABC transporter permease, partial [Microthrixaceae bacterium]|nr:ABC transporter permease [Microthrixaceae bacterium]
MTELLSLVLAGAVSGGLYAIMASGLVLTYQASGIFNLGHGAVAFVTALVYFQLHQPSAAGGVGLSTVPAAIISILIVAPAIGALLDVALFRKLASAPVAARLVGTVGVLIALPAAAFLIIDAINLVFGSEMPDVAGDAGLSPPGVGPSPAKSWSIMTGVSINSDQVAVLVAAAIAAIGLWFLMSRTRLGLETRAGVDRPVLARLRGIDTDRSSRIVWALSTMLAGCAGVLIAPLFDLSPITFHMIVFTSFTAAVAAKLKSVPIAFAAGIALGVIQNLVYGYAPDALTAISGFRSSVPFLLMFVLLFFVQGRGRVAGSVAEDAPGHDSLADLSPWRRRTPWIVAGIAFAIYGLFFADGYWTGVLNRGLVLSLVFLSFVVVTGIGGMINLAQATFVTVGGFTAGWLVNHQWSSTIPVIMDNGRLVFWVAILASVVVAAGVGALVALPSIRLGGLTLALATLALAFIGDRLVFQLEGVRNGSKGWSIRRPTLGPIDLGDDRTLFIVLIVMVLGCVWVVGNLARSATGRSLLALRSSPVAAATSGIDPLRSKLVLFAVSAGLAGFAGAWFALVNSPMTNLSAPPLLGLIWLAVAVTFGIRRPGGAVVAGIVYAAMPVVLLGIGDSWGAPWSSIPDGIRELIARPEFAAMLFGLGAIGLAREPDGVLAEVASGLRDR